MIKLSNILKEVYYNGIDESAFSVIYRLADWIQENLADQEQEYELEFIGAYGNDEVGIDANNGEVQTTIVCGDFEIVIGFNVDSEEYFHSDGNSLDTYYPYDAENDFVNDVVTIIIQNKNKSLTESVYSAETRYADSDLNKIKKALNIFFNKPELEDFEVSISDIYKPIIDVNEKIDYVYEIEIVTKKLTYFVQHRYKPDEGIDVLAIYGDFGKTKGLIETYSGQETDKIIKYFKKLAIDAMRKKDPSFRLNENSDKYPDFEYDGDEDPIYTDGLGIIEEVHELIYDAPELESCEDLEVSKEANPSYQIGAYFNIKCNGKFYSVDNIYTDELLVFSVSENSQYKKLFQKPEKQYKQFVAEIINYLTEKTNNVMEDYDHYKNMIGNADNYEETFDYEQTQYLETIMNYTREDNAFLNMDNKLSMPKTFNTEMGTPTVFFSCGYDKYSYEQIESELHFSKYDEGSATLLASIDTAQAEQSGEEDWLWNFYSNEVRPHICE